MNIKAQWPKILIVLTSLILHLIFLFYNPGISYNDPEVYPQEMRNAYGDNIINYGGYDGVNYGKSAEQLVFRGFLGFNSNEPNAYVTPGQPLFLATNLIISNFFDYDYIIFTKIINMFLSIVTPLLLYLISFRLFNGLVALIAGMSYALYFPPLHFFRSLLSETPSIFLFCFSIYLFVLAYQENKARYHISFSIIFSITLMFKPVIAPLVIIPIVIVITNWGIKKSLLIARLWLTGPLLIIVPWVLRNAIVLQEFILFSTQQNPFFAGSLPFNIENYNQEYQRLEDSGLSPTEFTILRIEEGLKTNPILWISWYTIGKTMYLFRRPSGWTDYWIQYSEFTSLFYSHHFVIIITALFSIILYWNQRIIKYFALLIIIYIGVSNIFVVDERYGFFIMPLVVILSAVLLSRILVKVFQIKKYTITG